MTTTVNIAIENTWTLVAPASDLAVSACHPTDVAEWVVVDTGVPAESLTGHPVPRGKHLSMALSGTEKLFIRNTGNSSMIAVVSTITP